MPTFVRKAFNKDYELIPYAIYDDDFIVEIPEDCVLKKKVVRRECMNCGGGGANRCGMNVECGSKLSLWFPKK